MSVDLRPLLSGFVAMTVELSQVRLDKPVIYMLADQADPGLPDPVVHSSCSVEARLRGRMLACAARMHFVGLPAAISAALALDGVTPAQRAMLLAAPGFAVWRQDGCRLWDPWSRPAACGHIYQLETTLGPAAPHAEHAASYLTQSLCLTPPDQPPAVPILIVPAVTQVCLSLQCALRDVVVGLLRDGQDQLATEVARVAGLHPLLHPATGAPVPLPIDAAG